MPPSYTLCPSLPTHCCGPAPALSFVPCSRRQQIRASSTPPVLLPIQPAPSLSSALSSKASSLKKPFPMQLLNFSGLLKPTLRQNQGKVASLECYLRGRVREWEAGQKSKRSTGKGSSRDHGATGLEQPGMGKKASGQGKLVPSLTPGTIHGQPHSSALHGIVHSPCVLLSPHITGVLSLSEQSGSRVAH